MFYQHLKSVKVEDIAWKFSFKILWEVLNFRWLFLTLDIHIIFFMLYKLFNIDIFLRLVVKLR